MSRSGILASTFVYLAEAVVADFDVDYNLQRLVHDAVEVFDAVGAGVVLVDIADELRIDAASDPLMYRNLASQLASAQGPCVDVLHRLAPVHATTTQTWERWPVFAPRALADGYHAVSAFPMRAHGEIIGVLNIFRSEPQPVWDNATAQALADVAAICLSHRRILRESLRPPNITAPPGVSQHFRGRRQGLTVG